MAKEKQHGFSARTTEEGLSRLNEPKGRVQFPPLEVTNFGCGVRFELKA